MKAYLVLEDGSYFEGKSFGDPKETFGEIVFNTAMTGYQEILTDPSYKDQIVVMTYPLIGNYGFNREDNESNKPHVQGFIVKELCDFPSNWRNEGLPEDFFNHHGIGGIYDIDTRQLTQHIRNFGSMYGVISTSIQPIDELVLQAKEYAKKKRDLVGMVTTKVPVHYSGTGKRIAVIDFGVKQNILRSLANRHCEVYVFPAHSTSTDILAVQPDGILFSNGPGDPTDIPYAVETAKELIGVKPIMGICLGHQLLGLALGGQIYKLKFGHHGGNHPVKDLRRNRVYITSQNHNFALQKSLGPDIDITHVNINDQTVEGFLHKRLPILSVQYHPEASPGPMDSEYIFDEFMQLIETA